jgi:pSer/pThr/pTyr-binding forkhead associated (FHA) protein
MSALLLKFQEMRFPLRLGETLLGRSPYCSIVLSDARVSRQHAAIRVAAEGVSIEDLGGRNGTYVNGERVVGRRWLVPGDVIQLGGLRLEVELSARDALAPSRVLAVTGEFRASPEEDMPTEPGGAPSRHCDFQVFEHAAAE